MSILQKVIKQYFNGNALQIYGSAAVTPTRAVITRWGSDPYALGSFSYVGVGSSGSDYDVLAKPVDNRLFFAGEHTHRHHPSTVTGGYMR
jgi:monoamine oxidase